MKKASRYDRKNLKNRLTCIMMIYLDGLNPRKKDKMKKYVDNKLGDVVDYYVRLFKKKRLKEINGPIKPEEIERLCPESKETKKGEEVSMEAPVLQ